MNVNLPQPRGRAVLLFALFLLGVSYGLSGQAISPYRNLAGTSTTPIRDTISGLNLQLNKVNPLAKHGDVALNILTSGGAGNPAVFEVLYTPDAGFVGTDTFALEYNYIGSYPYLVYQGFRVSVYPTVLNVRMDYAFTTTNTPITLNVLANDNGSSGPLQLRGVPLVNNGTATVVGTSQIVFTPESGFIGTAHLNYVVCDAANHCKTGQTSIGVHPATQPASDSLRIATTKNNRITIPLPVNGYTIQQAPANGSVILFSGQYFRYTPNNNFTGTDQFVLGHTVGSITRTKTVLVDVLNAPPVNMMAMNDQVFTPRNQPITFNVRANDIGNLLVKSWIVPSGFPGTLTNKTAGGNVTFTPTPGFTGMATFSYKIGNQFVPNIEIATVNILVSNLPPHAATYEMTTPKATPFVVNYDLPFTAFNFSVLDAPDHGTCTFYPGYSSQNINGFPVAGTNLLIYQPVAGFIGVDEFEINYCVSTNGQCQSVKLVMNVTEVFGAPGPYCAGDCVWPGDINRDGIVNNKDLLPLGYAMGVQGPARANASLEWYGQAAANWNNPYIANDQNDLKYSDTDGDGAVTADDTLALRLFYGQTDNLIPQIPDTGKGLAFFLHNLTPNAGPGDLVQVEVSLGNNTLPVTNLYGFTFDAQLSPLIQDSLLHMQFYDNSWLNLNSPSLSLSQNPAQHRLETAFTRTSNTSTNGFGPIGTVSFIIIDIIDVGKPGSIRAGSSNAAITVSTPTFLWGDGSSTQGGRTTLDIQLRSNDKQQTVVSNADFFAYPSPANTTVNFHLNGDDFMETLTVTDVSGREMYQAANLQAEHAQIAVQDWPQGIYIASARTSTGLVVKKFQVMRQ